MPSAIYTNYPKYNLTEFNVTIDNFIHKDGEDLAKTGDEAASSEK